MKQGTGANVTTKEFNPPVWVLTQGTSSEEPAYLEPENRSHEIHSSFANNWKYDDSIPINQLVKNTFYYSQAVIFWYCYSAVGCISIQSLLAGNQTTSKSLANVMLVW